MIGFFYFIKKIYNFYYKKYTFILMYKIYLVLLILIILLLLLENNSLYNEKFNNNNPYDNIDIIYYINLTERTDRKDHFLLEMDKMNIPSDKVHRFNAIKNTRGEVGCSYSHIRVLEEFIDSDYNNCIIFEDDFEFIISKEEFENLIKQVFDNKIDYDVIMLGCNVREIENTKYNFLYKLLNGHTTSGYLISKKFAPILLQNYLEGAKLLEENTVDKYDLYAIDQYWKKLQPDNNWYVFNPKVGIQMESFSDIHKVVVNYYV